MKARVIYVIIGIGLLVGVFSTRIQTIDPETLALIERAREVDMENELWPGYKFSDYPLDVNYGKVEFKYLNGRITKQKPTIDILAMTAIQEEDGPVIKVLPEAMIRKMSDTKGDKSKKGRGDVYMTFLFHEGFHCFQLDENIGYNIDMEEPIDDKFYNILNRLDNDSEYKNLWIREAVCLTDYLENNNKVLWVEAYNKRMVYLEKILEEDFAWYMTMENEFELIEGTAKYVEDKLLERLTGEFVEPTNPNLYYNGTGKFYNNGRLKALILDKGVEWKKDVFEFEKTLTSMIS